MGADKWIKMDRVSFNEAYVLSFESEKAFVDKEVNNSFLHHQDLKTRKELLKTVYKIAKGTAENKDSGPDDPPGPGHPEPQGPKLPPK